MPTIEFRRRTAVLLSLLMSVWAIGGCTQTVGVFSVTEFRPEKQYTHVLFATGYTDRGRVGIAAKIRESLSGKGLKCQYFWDLFPAQDGYSPFPSEDEFSISQFLERVDSSRIDAILVVFPCDVASWEEEWQDRPEEADNRVDGFGGFHWLRREGRISGQASSHWNDAAAELYDARTGSLVWTMAISSRGAAMVTVEQLAGSIGKKAISGLARSHIIP